VGLAPTGKRRLVTAHAETGRVLFRYIPAGPGGLFEQRLGRPTGSINGEEANEIRRRYGWEIVGPPPF
jgi:hypothetical protein